MMRRVANIAVLLVAAFLCYGMQTTTPHYADLTAPIPVYGKIQDTILTRTFDIAVDKVVFARTLKFDQFGKQNLLTSGGVWAIVTARLDAADRSAMVAAATWQGPDRLNYRTSERASSAAGALPIALDPGVPGRTRLVFEILPSQVSGATLLVSGKLAGPLDSEARIALGSVATQPNGLPEGVTETYELGDTF
ncbi:hypothetical protein [Mesorhizobium sp. 1M-11]|uniref:hypothetical protein n=1 Tax=Mesorhizobium sp. 1M-11 TaxID=1529006 RepID=UPI0006C76A30|nr:hypothetical protein [Mesorhizobium sp. 1M-11]